MSIINLIWLPRGSVWTDSQHDLISLLVNISNELGQIMARYDILEPRWVILSNIWTAFNFTYFGQLFMWIRANNDQIWPARGKMSDFKQYLNWLCLNFWSALHMNWGKWWLTFGQLCIWIGANGDQIWLHRGEVNDFEKMLEPTPILPAGIVIFGQLFIWIEYNNDQIWLLNARVVILLNVWTDSQLS